MPTLAGIYCFKNCSNGKIYIGQSIDIGRRFAAHKRHLNNGNHYNSYLQRAWDKDKDYFEFDILEVIRTNSLTKEQIYLSLNKREQFHIQRYISDNREYGYNLRSGGQDNFVISKTTRLRLSEAQKGRKHLEKTKRKIGKAHKGRKLSKQHRVNISASKIRDREKTIIRLKGVPRNEETKQKLREANRGKKLSEEHKQKISNSLKGKKHTEETKRKISRTKREKNILTKGEDD